MTIDDEITIDEAIDMIKHILEVTPKEPPTECDYVEEWLYEDNVIRKTFNMAIKALEQTTWTPVSEELPKDNGWYQCTVISDNLILTMDLFYKDGKWLDNRRINMFNTYDIYGYGNSTEKHKLSYQELISEFDWTENVMAWMPLLKPYKIESEG